MVRVYGQFLHSFEEQFLGNPHGFLRDDFQLGIVQAEYLSG